MFKIPININNQTDISSVIESIVEGLGQDVESSMISDILNDFHKQNTPQQTRQKNQASVPKTANIMNALFDKVLNTQPAPTTSPESEYSYELSESSESFVISVDMPGVSKEDILISYDNSNTLHVECDRKPTDACLVVLKSNIVYGNKSLNLHLKNASSNVDTSDVLASYNNGTLVVSIPKKRKSNSTNYIQVQ